MDSQPTPPAAAIGADREIREFIEYVARALVDHPDEVRVNQIGGTSANIFELQVAPRDLGQIIGRDGRNLKAFRHLIYALSSKSRSRVLLEIIE